MTDRWTTGRRFSEVDLALFAGATRNPHLIHLNPDIARVNGLSDLVVQSHLVPAALLAYFDERLKLPNSAQLSKVSWQNRAPLSVNQHAEYSVSCLKDGQQFDWDVRVDRAIVASGSFLIA